MVQMISRKWLSVSVVAGVLAVLAASSSFAQGNNYPSKPIQLTIPWPPGGRTDVVSRMFAACLEKGFGSPVVVNNMVGGAGLIGSLAVRNAKPDGYTISVGGIGLAIIQHQRKTDLKLTDFTWISRIYWAPLVVAVPAESPFKTFGDLAAYGKANPGKLRHGNSIAGGSTHIASEMMARSIGIKLTQMPYRGEGLMAVGLASGEPDFSIGLMPTFRPFVEDKKVRVIGVADTQRNELFPDIPTLKEQGYDVVLPAFEALFVPKSTPENVLSTLSRQAKICLTDQELKKRFADIGVSLSYQDSKEFTPWFLAFDKELKSTMDGLGLSNKE